MDVTDVRGEPPPTSDVDLSPVMPPTTEGGRPWFGAVAVAVVLAAAVALRFWTRSDLWLDEAQTVAIARHPLSQLTGALRHDGAPPLYYVLLHFWIRLFGNSDLAVRSLSGVFGVACLPVAWLAGHRAGRARGEATARATGWAALLLLATSPFATHYSTEARMYSLVVLLTLIGYLCLTSVLADPVPRALPMAGLAACTGLLLLTHYWAEFLLVATGGYLLVRAVRRPDERRYRYAFAAMAAGCVLFVPWLPTFLYQLRHTGTPWADPASFTALVNSVSEFSGGKTSAGRGLGLVFFALLGFGVFGRGVDERHVDIDLRTQPDGRGLGLVLVGTLVIAIAAGLVLRSAFQARYASVVLAPFILLAALGTDVLLDRKVRHGVLAVAFALGLAGCGLNVVTNRTQAGIVARKINQVSRPGDAIGYCPDQLGVAASRIVGPGRPQLTFPRIAAPQTVDWVGYGAAVKAGDPAAFAAALNRAAGPGHDVYLVYSGDYHLFSGRCEAVIAAIGALRPKGTSLIAPDQHQYFEHAGLARFSLP